MKYNFNFLLILLLANYACAQYNEKNYNQFSIEGAYNISVPYTATNFKDNSNGNFTSFEGFNMGARYMFNPHWGLKGEVVYNGYHGENNLGTNFTRLDMQAVYNLGSLINLAYATNDKVGLLMHSGFGLSKSKSLVTNTTENIGNYIVGLTPIFRLSDRIALSMDMTYVANFKQQFNYDGRYFNNDKNNYKFGYNINYSFGLIFYMGNKKRQADWY